MVILEYACSILEGPATVEPHRDHLLMGMSTALAFYTFLKLSEPVVGFLIDANFVEILVGWHSDPQVSTHRTPLQIPNLCRSSRRLRATTRPRKPMVLSPACPTNAS